MTAEPQSAYEFGPCRLDPAQGLLLCDDEPVPLTPKAFATLHSLVRRRGRVAGKEELLQEIWPDSYVEEATLTQNIYTLRKALAAAGVPGTLIETLPRRGYRFCAEVRRLVDDADQRPATGSPLRHVRTIAVLPLRVLSRDPNDPEAELTAVGMADAMITRLGNLRALTVRPTSSVVRAVSGDADALEVGRRLGVQAVLEGTLQITGERCRVTLQLVDVEAGCPLWAEGFDARSADPFALQDSISQQVVAALGLAPTRRERRRLERPATASSEAYRAYVRGRYLWNKRTERDLRAALDCFRRAAQIDPDYARAHAGAAECLVLLPLFGNVPPRDCFPAAIEAAERALELDGELPEAETALAYSRFIYEWSWEEAEAGFRRAIELVPTHANAHHWGSFFLAAQGRHAAAQQAAQRAQELDPLSLVINVDLGLILHFGRRHAEAAEQLRETLELEPDFPYAHFVSSLTLGGLGDHAGAVTAAQRAVALTGEENTAMLAILGRAWALAGDRTQAREVLAELARRRAGGFVPASRLALVEAALGDDEAAVASLEEAGEERSRFAVFIAVWSVFDTLRDEPRFQRLLTRLGLDDVAREQGATGESATS